MNKPADLNITVGVGKWAHVVNLDVIGPAEGKTALLNVHQKTSTKAFRAKETHINVIAKKQS